MVSPKTSARSPEGIKQGFRNIQPHSKAARAKAFYNRLAAVLAAVLAVQVYRNVLTRKPLSPLERRSTGTPRRGVPAPVSPIQGKREARGARDDAPEKLLEMWEKFLEGGGKLQEGSAPLTTRKAHLKTEADVAGANIDHNMSITNPCATSSNILKRAFLEPLPPPFSAFGQHKFILRAGYRISPQDFVAVAMQLTRTLLSTSSFELRRYQKGECWWMTSDHQKIGGTFRAVYPGNHHNLMFATVLYFCQLDAPTTGEGGGGAVMRVDGEEFVFYSEGAKAAEIYRDPPFFLGFCSFPMYRELRPVAVRDWLQYHMHYAGVEYFVIQDGGSVDDEMYRVMEPYINAGVLEIVDIRGGYKYETKHNVLALNECMHRMSYVSKWVLFLDFDEFLFAEPPWSIRSILEEAGVAPYVTFGSLWWSVEHCRDSGTTNLEKMLFHWPHFYCVKKDYPQEKCLNFYGHRKFIVNPRRVEAVQVHRPIEPLQGGVDLNISVGFFNHFQGILRADKELCGKMHEKGEGPDWWKEDKKLYDVWVKVKERQIPKKIRQGVL